MDILRSVWARIGKDRVIAVAAGFTFYGLLAIFPAITATVSIYGLFTDPAQIVDQMNQLSGILPGGAIEVIGDQVKRIAEAGSSKLGFAFAAGLLTALWSANAGMKALFDALNVAYQESETRGFLSLNALSLAFTIATIAFISVALGAMILLPLALSYLHLDYAWIGVLLSLLRWPLLLGVIVVGLALLYRYGAAHKKPSWKWVTPGSIFASVAWVAASAGFAYYAAHFGTYNETYGTLGAAIGLMFWLWISAIVIMVGAEINAETEQEAKGAAPAVEAPGRAK